MDDVILMGSHHATLTHILSLLQNDFPFKDLGNLHYFLGIQCFHIASSLHLSQTKYITILLSKTNMSNCKPVTSPMSPSTKLSAFDSKAMEDPTFYRSVVIGSLQYLLIIRPELAFSVNRVCQYIRAPYLSHW